MSQLPERKHQFRTPWWAYILIAVTVYLGLAYYVPTLHSDNESITTFLQLLPNMAPIGAIGFLLLGAKALYDNDIPEGDPPPQDEEKKED